jgi:hypothetical protein
MEGQIVLRVIFDPKSGQVGFEGPIDNKILCLGMLALAEKIVNDHVVENRMLTVVSGNGLPRQN